ncbi:uncharacterized protein DS421_12g382900 [Arachis hypogaea]|nr:uncharacterized protein DS421_12g382900 [Arachis hypogaea]
MLHNLAPPRKCILADDESTGTIGKCLSSINVEKVETNRRALRELLFTPGALQYLSGVILFEKTMSFLIHHLSKKLTQKLPFKLHGLAVRSTFRPSRSIFFICTKQSVRVYDLLKIKLIKKLDTGLREASSIAVHPGGDNLIVGSKEGKLCWFDMDLSSKPYKTLKKEILHLYKCKMKARVIINNR